MDCKRNRNAVKTVYSILIGIVNRFMTALCPLTFSIGRGAPAIRYNAGHRSKNPPLGTIRYNAGHPHRLVTCSRAIMPLILLRCDELHDFSEGAGGVDAAKIIRSCTLYLFRLIANNNDIGRIVQREEACKRCSKAIKHNSP